ncbi:MAG: ABC transporter ATP-binding protein [Mycoplasmataceae bacterium]|nr:ABC transporter ATP-binding protein [Mycoplasmataceae bacterium]
MNKLDYKFLFIGSIFTIISTVCGATLPFILGKIINAAEVYNDTTNNLDFPTNTIIFNLLFMLMFGFFGLLFTYFGRWFLAKFSTSKLAEVRRNVFIKIQYLSPEDLKDHKDNSLLTRLQLDNLNYSTYLNFLIITFIPAIFRFIIFSIMCLVLNYIVALFLIGFAGLFYIIIFIMSMNAEKSYIEALDLTDSLNRIIKENITGARVVKAFNLKERQRQRFIKINDSLIKTSTKAEKKVFNGWPFSLAFVAATSVIIILTFALISWWMPNSITNLGNIIAFINYSYLIMWSVFELIVIQIFRARSLASKKRIQEILILENNHFNEKGNMFKPGDIHFDNVSFKYNDDSIDYVLRDISFTIKQNTRVGIIGSTGSGKSSLINLITRLFDSQEGNIKIGGINIKDINTNDLINNISISFQQKYLFSGTIKSNIKFGNEDITDDEILKLLKISEMKFFIDSKKEGINYKLEQNGQNLSGGQKQRVSIARTLAKKSKILIFDDATSALDNITELKILESINSTKKNITQIFVAQKISTIKNMDQIIVLDKGFIVGEGTHDELIKHCNVYKEINKFQDKAVK